jgi:hypothetical protein
MDNVQSCDCYINVPSSQTCGSRFSKSLVNCIRPHGVTFPKVVPLLEPHFLSTGTNTPLPTRQSLHLKPSDWPVMQLCCIYGGRNCNLLMTVEAGCNFWKGGKTTLQFSTLPLLFSFAHSLNHPLWHHPSPRRCNKGNGEVCVVPGGCWEPWLSTHNHPESFAAGSSPRNNETEFRHMTWVAWGGEKCSDNFGGRPDGKVRVPN